MKLPNGERAVADIAKFRDYCLDAEHPAGKHKARVFRAALGYTQDNAVHLRQLALVAARTKNAIMDQLMLFFRDELSDHTPDDVLKHSWTMDMVFNGTQHLNHSGVTSIVRLSSIWFRFLYLIT